MKGLIFSIKKYSVHDGPGIRVTFFMKGCPLNCLWCHNPEGLDPFPEQVVIKRRVGDREFDHVESAGKYYSVEEILHIAGKESVFMKHSGGGVTFSGGEPMMQTEFVLEALKAFKRAGYHTTIDTSGYTSRENLWSVIPYTDLFLFDLKHLDDQKHIELTGVSNETILDNYAGLMQSGIEIIIRIPVIPGYNDDQVHLEKMRKFIDQTKTSALRKICLLPYHKTGTSKYARFNVPNRIGDIEPPSQERMRELKKYFSETGIAVKTGG